MCKLIIINFVFFSFITHNVYADMSQNQQNALYNTQKLLKNEKSRMDSINSSKEAQKAHQDVVSLFGGSQNINKAYDMAAIALEALAKEANGDPAKMAEILNEAKKDPAAFANKMPPEFRSMLKQAAQDVENKNAPKLK